MSAVGDAWIHSETVEQNERFREQIAKLRDECKALREVYTAMLVLLDHVDYTRQNCSATEMVGAVLPYSVINQCHIAMSDITNTELGFRL
jgi:hypothetical protein